MHPDNDEWMMKKIFHMSDHALIRMVNHLFGTEYEDGEYVQKEWKGTEGVRICLLIGCANRYEFQMRRFGKCLQIHAEDRGCLFYYEDAAKYPVLQLREPGRASFGKNTREEYRTILEFQGNERVVLPVCMAFRGGRSDPFCAFFILLFCIRSGNAGNKAGVVENFCNP